VNVAAATDFGRTADGHFFLVLEYVGGVTLRDMIQAGPMAADRAIFLALQIARALTKAHSLGIVHRDLKPENVIVVHREGEPELVKILDFGVAKVPIDAISKTAGSQPMTKLGVIYGTAGYMAPEQALGEAVDGRADLYAVGATLYEMLSGLPPFDGDDAVSILGKQVTQRAPSLKTRAPSVDVPAALDALVMRLLEPQASARYQSAEELVAALEGLWTPQRAPVRIEPTQPVRTLDLTKNGAPENLRALAVTMASRTRRAWSTTAAWTEPRARRAFAMAKSTYENARAKLPARWRPAAPFLVAAAAMFIVALPIVFLRGSSTHEGSEAKVDAGSHSVEALPSASIRQAAHTGATALEDLALEYPEDARIQRELVRVHTTAGRGAAAMRALARLAALDPATTRDEEMNDALLAAIDGPADASGAAIRVAEGPFGARGVDILLDCASRSGAAQTRCTQALAKAEVRDHASPAAAVLIELREAKDCEEKRAAVERAGEQGDSRALAELRSLSKKSGCGRRARFDCWPCLRKDHALDDAVASIEARGRERATRSDSGAE
jgi:serine/threonine-protein kinase